jgi:hypothetical protein
MALPTMRLVVIVVVALLVAVALAVLLVPSTSWAAALEWFTNPPHISPCGCNVDPGSNG